MVDIAQDVVINEEDCGTINGIEYSAVKDGDDIIEPLKDRIVGRYTLERVLHLITGELLCDVNQYIDDELAEKIDAAGVETVKLRTVLTCESWHRQTYICHVGESCTLVSKQSIHIL